MRHEVPIPAALHLYAGWRRVTVTLAWFSPINPGNRKYRVTRLGLDVPGDKESPLRVTANQVHTDATTRGTVQHIILERPRAVINVGDDDVFEVCVTCDDDAGELKEPVPYALAVSLEVSPGKEIPVYHELAARLSQRVVIAARPRR